MNDKPDYTCDIDLKTYFDLLYNVNCNVNEKIFTVKEQLDGVLIRETLSFETVLKPVSVMFSDIAPTVILKDGNENVSVLEYNVMNKHWFEVKDLIKHNLLHSLGMCV
jgi:hypothetical protein